MTGQVAGLLMLALNPAPNPTDIDLNRDGVVDHVRLECEWSANSYTLFVNDVAYRGVGEVFEGTFSLVDIDTTDSFIEIAVPQLGPSDDYATYFHWYDGKSIHFMNVVPGTYDLQIDGSGRVRTEDRGQVLQTWFYPCVFSLDPDRRLRKVVGELYPMRTQCMMKLALPLCASRSDSTVVTVLHPGDSVVLEASDDSTWCLVRAPSGVWGWFRLARYQDVLPLGLPGSDVFDGLSYAD